MYNDQTLPKDPIMLLSVVNMRLRDQFDNLDKLCEFYNVEKTILCKRLAIVGYDYDDATNQFK